MKRTTWKVLEDRNLVEAPPWLSLSVQSVELPDGRQVEDFYQLKIPDFVVVFAQTRESKVVMLRQYKHGAGRVSLTLPGGGVEPGEVPAEAVKRELLEETGYQATNWHSLGSYTVNGNLGCGQGHFFRAEDAIPIQLPNSGDLEEMEVLTLTMEEVQEALANGDVALLNHGAAISMALTRCRDYPIP